MGTDQPTHRALPAGLSRPRLPARRARRAAAAGRAQRPPEPHKGRWNPAKVAAGARP